MKEFNLVNLKQDIGLPDASEKMRKGKTGLPVRRQTGKEAEQMMPFACVMGNACRATTQKTGEIPSDPRSDKGKIGGRSNKGNATRRGGAFNMDPENNLLSAGTGKTEKTNQSLPVKGKAAKTNGSFSGKIDLLTIKDSQEQTGGKVKNLQGSSGLKKSKVGISHTLTGDAKGPLKLGLNKQSIESGLTKSELIKAVVEKNEAVKESGSLRAADTVGQNFRTGKIAVAVSKEGSFRESWAGINNVLVRGQKAKVKGQRSEGKGQRAEVRGQMAKMDDALGVLSSGLKNAAAAKGKTDREPNSTGKKSFTLIKNNGGKNSAENLLKHSILKGEETAAQHEKTGIKGFADHNMEILHRKISSPSHSDKISSSGAYHHTSFYSGDSSAAVNKSVNSSGIEPRVLIDQIASAAKRSGRVRITLNPPSLGKLDMNVLVRDHKVHVVLQVENNDVRQILQSNLESLKSSLRNHGLVADTINVSVQDKSDGSNYGADYRSGQNETLFKEGGKREGNQEDHAGGRDFLNNDPSSFEEENPRGRSNGRVSLFA
ncbi:MAG: flagellar hook-length control protein FliK [Spirochaetales bacterium]|nr:flagellar hook-length control protein FliK [Spirochaetales bacterium]